MKIDELVSAGEAAAEAKLEEIIAREKEPIEQEAEQARLEAGAAVTDLATKTSEWAAERLALNEEIKRLTSNTLPPERPTFGTPGEKTRITSPMVLAGKNIVGWLEVATNDFILDDFQLDVSTSGATSVSGIAIDTRYSVMGRTIISRGLVGSSRPSALTYGIVGGNLIVEDLEIRDVVDGVNAHSGSFTARRVKGHSLGQYATDPKHTDGSHGDLFAFGTGILDVLIDDCDLDAGVKTVAGSLTGLMLSPGVPRSLHIYRTTIQGGHPAINMAAATTLTDVRLVDVLLGPDPEFGGAGIIAKSAQIDLVKAGMVRTTMLDGSPVVFKKG